MNTYVLCAGGHARVVISALHADDVVIAGITDRDAGLVGMKVEGVDIIGADDVLPPASDGIFLYNGLGNIAQKNNSGLEARRALFEKFVMRGYRFPVLVSSRAVVASSARIDDGAQIMIGAIVQAGAHIGENTIVNTAAIIEHDCIVGAHCHIAPGAILCGGVILGNQCHVGAGAIVLQGQHIPPGSIVPAGSVVRGWK